MKTRVSKWKVFWSILDSIPTQFEMFSAEKKKKGQKIQTQEVSTGEKQDPLGKSEKIPDKAGTQTLCVHKETRGSSEEETREQEGTSKAAPVAQSKDGEYDRGSCRKRKRGIGNHQPSKEKKREER